MNIFFNATYYLNNNPDVLQAVAQGIIPSAKFHFDNFGWQEGRDPNAFFDVSYYLTENPDVLEAGVNPLDHFIQFGAAEGRSPNADFVSSEDFDTEAYAAANPDLEAAGITTPEELYAHFVTYGFAEDRPGTQTNEGTPIVDGLPGGLAGDDFTLTDGVDEFIGTAGNDTFQGLVEDLSNFDDLAGGAGDDVLNLYVEGSGTDVATSSTVDVEGIETVNFIYDDSATSITGTIDGDTFQGATQIWQIGDAQAIEDLAATQTAGFRDTDVTDVTVTAADDVTSMSIALDKATEHSGSEALVLEGADLETVTVAGSLVTDSDATDDGNGLGLSLQLTKGVETLNLSMTTDTDLRLTDGEGAATLVTFDASGSTGDIYLDASGAGDEVFALKDISFGSGDDTVMANLASFKAAEVALDTGTGADDITIDVTNSTPGKDETDADVATALTIDAGTNDGTDLITIVGGNISLNDETPADGFDGNAVTITNFSTASKTGDILAIDSFDGFVNSTLVATAITTADAESLFDAVTAAAGVVDESSGDNEVEFAEFEYEGNTYIYGDRNDNGLDDGDLLIEVTGVLDLGNSVINPDALLG